VQEPGATSVKPPSWTIGRPLVTSSGQRSTGAGRTARSKSRFRQSERSVAPRRIQASCAAWPTWAIAFPAVIGSLGLIHNTGVPSGTACGGSGSSSSVPATCNLASSGGHSSTGTGGYTRISADPCVIVIPGSAEARSHPAPRARRTTLRMRPSAQACTASAHSPSASVTRGSSRNRRTAWAAPSSASVRAGGESRSTRTTSGNAYWGASSRLSTPRPYDSGETGPARLTV
jgi:hypothetical protein